MKVRVGAVVLFRVVGVIAGGCAFAGFFVGYFSGYGFALSGLGSRWLDLIPVGFGISTLALMLPPRVVRVNILRKLWASLALVFAGLGLGVGLGARILGAVLSSRVGFGYGPGFWLILFGGLGLVGAWAAITIWKDAGDPSLNVAGSGGA